jgi:hypothetical protein
MHYRWLGFCDWCKELSRTGYSWEAQGIFRLLLSVIPSGETENLFDEIYRNLEKNDRSEPELLAQLDATNSYVRYLVRDEHNMTDAENLARAQRFLARPESVSEALFKGMSLGLKGRPFLEFRLAALEVV